MKGRRRRYVKMINMATAFRRQLLETQKYISGLHAGIAAASRTGVI